jgi:two-component system LytT family response regulator
MPLTRSTSMPSIICSSRSVAFRLGQALERFKSLTSAAKESSVDQARRIHRSGPARFLAKKGDHFVVVMESRVLYFASEEGLTKLVTEADQYWMNSPLNDLEARVDPNRFFRISRAALVNLNAVTEAHPLPGGSGQARLKTGERLEISRRRFSEFLEWLGGADVG